MADNTFDELQQCDVLIENCATFLGSSTNLIISSLKYHAPIIGA